MIETPILFLVFNRPDVSKRVFEQIKLAKPRKLYIASDAARSNKEGEAEIVLDLRDFLLKNIDWDCTVSTLFREENLGCKYAVSSAIDWFFHNEEQGIILEDDCLPEQSFFRYCEELLIKYKNDKRIWHIAGNNFHFGQSDGTNNSYYFGGIYGSIWGWASWRDRWAEYDAEIKAFEEDEVRSKLALSYDGSEAVVARFNDFQLIKDGLDTWDFQWVFARWMNKGLTIVPSVNLIKNIGFSEEATHTQYTKDKRSDMEVEAMSFPLIHPEIVERNASMERQFYEDFIKLKPLDHLKIYIKKLVGK